MAEQSILQSTKKILGVTPEDESFDLDIITHINSAFSTLTDLGVGPETGFVIEDSDPVWTDFLEDEQVMLAKVKTFVYLNVRIIFDPPVNGFVMDALRKQIEECTWRLSVNREAKDWVDPDPHPRVDVPFEYDTHYIEGG